MDLETIRDMTPDQARVALVEIAERRRLTLEVDFVPWSRDQCDARPEGIDGKPWRCICWHYVLDRQHADAPMLHGMYRQGVGHIQYSRKVRPRTVEALDLETAAIERGGQLTREKNARVIVLRPGDVNRGVYATIAVPTIADILGCLLLDSEAIDYAGFEDWANQFGYNPDSIKARDTWMTCVETGLKLRQMLGDDFETARQIGAQL